MKATIRIMALVLIMGMLLLLVSCSASTKKLDIHDAKKALEKEGYDVWVSDGDSTPGMKEEFSADNDDDEELYIYVFESSKTAKLFLKQLEISMNMREEVLKATIKFQKHILDEYEQALTSDEIDEIKEELSECQDSLEKLEKQYTSGRKGDTVWFGTKNAIEDAWN